MPTFTRKGSHTHTLRYGKVSHTTDKVGLELQVRVRWVGVGGEIGGENKDGLPDTLPAWLCGLVRVGWVFIKSPLRSLWSFSLCPTFLMMSFSQSGPGVVDKPIAIAHFLLCKIIFIHLIQGSKHNYYLWTCRRHLKNHWHQAIRRHHQLSYHLAASISSL